MNRLLFVALLLLSNVIIAQEIDSTKTIADQKARKDTRPLSKESAWVAPPASG